MSPVAVDRHVGRELAIGPHVPEDQRQAGRRVGDSVARAYSLELHTWPQRDDVAPAIEAGSDRQGDRRRPGLKRRRFDHVVITTVVKVDGVRDGLIQDGARIRGEGSHVKRLRAHDATSSSRSTGVAAIRRRMIRSDSSAASRTSS